MMKRKGLFCFILWTRTMSDDFGDEVVKTVV